MRKPDKRPNPVERHPLNRGFAGPFEIGWGGLGQIFPGLDREAVHLETPPRVEDGGVSLKELALIAAIARWLQPRRVLEIGTFQGWTTHNIALQLTARAEVVTVDLPLHAIPRLGSDGWNEKYLPSRGRRPVFVEKPTRSRIRRIEGDTAELEAREVGQDFEMIFIDGAHSAAYLENDTSLALAVAAPSCVILWHDYAKPRRWPAVTGFLHSISIERQLFPLFWLHHQVENLDTSLVLYVRSDD